MLRIIVSEFNKIQDYSEVNNVIMTYYFGCELDSVNISAYLCYGIILVKFAYIAVIVVLFTKFLYIL